MQRLRIFQGDTPEKVVKEEVESRGKEFKPCAQSLPLFTKKIGEKGRRERKIQKNVGVKVEGAEITFCAQQSIISQPHIMEFPHLQELQELQELQKLQELQELQDKRRKYGVERWQRSNLRAIITSTPAPHIRRERKVQRNERRSERSVKMSEVQRRSYPARATDQSLHNHFN